MTGSIQAPARGEKIRASWGAAVTERVNSMSAIGGDDRLVREGATGFGFAPLPANRRLRRGGTVTPPGNFEPVFALKEKEEKEGSQSDPPRILLDHVGVGFYPFGCRFFRVDGLTIDESAKIAHGMIWLEIVVSGSSDDHTATVKGESYDDETEGDGEGEGEGSGEGDGEGEGESEGEGSGEGDEDSDPFVNDGTNGKFQIPLYEIKDGAIKTDFRSCMSLPIRIY